MMLRRAMIVLLVLAPLARGQTLSVSTDHADGVYKTGDTVHWTIVASEVPKISVEYVVKRGGLTEIARGKLAFEDNRSTLDTKLDAPGSVLLELAIPSTKAPKPAKYFRGAVADPEKIQLSAQKPDDFETFWKSKIDELQAVPVNDKIEKADAAKAAVDYFKITMDNIRGTHIRGQLARPTNGEKFPALLIVQWAGVYPLQKAWTTDRAADGWLCLNIEAHDLPIDEPESFYKQQFDGPLKNYWSIGNDDRDTSYFLRMYLSGYRGLEYLMSRPDWDGKTLVVMGGSQGGMQTLMLAGLHPQNLTAALAVVPAGCDMLGPDVGRAPGWPQWYSNVEGKDPAKVRTASRYYDIANFATSIRCPVLIGLGLIDQTCPPAGIFAAANQIKSPKELVILPHSDHQGIGDSQRAYFDRCYKDWLPALLKGAPAPVAQK